MRATLTMLTAAVLLALAAGCDSAASDDGADTRSDGERIRNVWEVRAADDGKTDYSALVTSPNAFRAVFTDTSFTFSYHNSRVPGEEASLRGYYQLNPMTGLLGLMALISGQQVPYVVRYRFAGDETLELTVDAAMMNLLLGTAITGSVRLTLVPVAVQR